MRRQRRKQHQAHGNQERWVVSYADFITLLFAFFVVMYSISSVNEGKYRVLSQTLTDAFQEPKRSLDPIQIGDFTRSRGDLAGLEANNSLIDLELNKPQDEPPPPAPPSNATEQQRLSFLAATIEDMLEDYVERKLVEVSFTDNRVMVDMKDKMLFPSGSADLSGTAARVLRDVSRILASVPNQVQVEGNTDNIPISTEEFPSNWELSAARAASVVHLMSRMGVAPDRLSAIGYGEHRPVADNSNESGRQKNRRVTLVIRGLEGAPDRRVQLPGGAG
jgi:chemotaxis protein MotB